MDNSFENNSLNNTLDSFVQSAEEFEQYTTKGGAIKRPGKRSTPIKTRDLDIEIARQVSGPVQRSKGVTRHRPNTLRTEGMTPARAKSARLNIEDPGAPKNTMLDGREQFKVSNRGNGRKLVQQNHYKARGSALTDPQRSLIYSSEQKTNRTRSDKTGAANDDRSYRSRASRSHQERSTGRNLSRRDHDRYSQKGFSGRRTYDKYGGKGVFRSGKRGKLIVVVACIVIALIIWGIISIFV